MAWHKILTLASLLWLVESIPIDLTGSYSSPEYLPRPIARRSTSWNDYYWAAQRHYNPEQTFQDPSSFTRRDGYEYIYPSEIDYESHSQKQEYPYQPIHIWRVTPTQKYDEIHDRRVQPLNAWIGEKISARDELPSSSHFKEEKHDHYYSQMNTATLNPVKVHIKTYEDERFNPEVSRNSYKRGSKKTGTRLEKQREDHGNSYYSDRTGNRKEIVNFVSTESTTKRHENTKYYAEKVKFKSTTPNYGGIQVSKKPQYQSWSDAEKKIYTTSSKPVTEKLENKETKSSLTKSKGTLGYNFTLKSSITKPYPVESRKNPVTPSTTLNQTVNQIDTLDHKHEDLLTWDDCDKCEEDCTELDDCESLDVHMDTDKELLENNFINSIDKKFRSLIFNPLAETHEKFQSCVTPNNETGNCRYIQHCFLSDIISGVQQFMSYVCLINNRFIGVCCPDFPVSNVDVQWDQTVSIENETAGDAFMPPECGISSKNRIVGGSKADPSEYPWMAALLTMNKGQFFCGGAVINERYILTAAHCTFSIPRNQILVRLGEYDFGNEDSEFPGEDYPVVEIKRHGLYSRRTLHHDIALLKLGRNIHFNKRVGTICLPKKNETFVGKTATLAGWGNTKGGGPSSDVLLEAALSVVENDVCAKEHGLPISSSSICTQSEDKERGACNGDSGGPLMLMNEDTKIWEAIGLVSWGRRGCEPKFPTVYTRITDYLDWIGKYAS